MLAENLENLVKKERMEGRQEGRLEGFAGQLHMQLAFEFGDLPPYVDEKLATATDDQLGDWGTCMLTATSLDELFKHLPRRITVRYTKRRGRPRHSRRKATRWRCATSLPQR